MSSELLYKSNRQAKKTPVENNVEEPGGYGPGLSWSKAHVNVLERVQWWGLLSQVGQKG